MTLIHPSKLHPENCEVGIHVNARNPLDSGLNSPDWITTPQTNPSKHHAPNQTNQTYHHVLKTSAPSDLGLNSLLWISLPHL
jgi:hypothetical protein